MIMNKIIGFFVFIVCVYSLINALSLTNSQSANYRVKPNSVHDGDTMRVISSEDEELKIRFACVDTREIGQEGGRSDRDFLISLLQKHNNRVKLEIMGKDRFGRTIAVVWAGNLLVPLAQVQAGQAFVYHQYADSCPYYEEIKQAEAIAQKKKIGLWGEKIEYPWEWRRRNKKRPR